MLVANEFRQKQRRVATGMLAAFIISVTVIAGTLMVDPGPALAVDERVVVALRADIFGALWLFASIANVARLRFFSGEDIDGSGMTQATESVRIGNAIVQNTLEQAVLAIAAHMAIAAVLPGSTLLVVALVVLFCIGRACFWVGYRKGASGRAFGFALTFYPTALTLLLSAVLVFVQTV
jgi:hypothetical protein